MGILSRWNVFATGLLFVKDGGRDSQYLFPLFLIVEFDLNDKFELVSDTELAAEIRDGVIHIVDHTFNP